MSIDTTTLGESSSLHQPGRIPLLQSRINKGVNLA